MLVLHLDNNYSNQKIKSKNIQIYSNFKLDKQIVNKTLDNYMLV